MPRPCFNQAVLDLALPQWAKFALARKWEAGQRDHQGTDDEFSAPEFDPLVAQAGEALDVILYYLAVDAGLVPHWAETHGDMSMAVLAANATDAAMILRRCGQTAAYAAATEALNRASI